MNKVATFCVTVLVFGSVALSQDQPSTPDRAPLLLVQQIPLPNVGGRIDHFTFDGKRKRVIGAALGNNTVEIVDTFAGRDVHSITGAANPQGVVYVGEFNKLFVANGADGKLRIYDGDSFKLLNTVDIGEDADNVRYDPAEKKIYVAFGGDEGGGIAVLDAVSGQRLEDVAKLDAHPESFQIATSKPVIYANIATKAKVALIDRNTHKVTDWPLKNGKSNYPMALDEADHRIFVVTRKPAQLVALDADSGATVASVPCVNDADDLYYDAGRKRIYVPGGEGFISVIQQTDADHYQALAKIPTTIGARTGLWYEKRDRFYLAVPASSKEGAALWVYAPEDLGDTMNRISKICLVAASVLIAYSGVAFSQESGKQPLRLVQTIPLPNVKGRLDHIDVDVKGKRLFVAGLENGTFEVVDLKTGKWLQSIPGFKKAQGALFVPELNKLFLASGDDGMVRVFRGDTLELLDSIHLEPGPNRVVYEPKSKLVYVGYGGKDAGKDYGEVGIIDARQDKHVGDIKVVAHPSEILLDKSGSTLFVFSSVANRLLVIDASKREVVSTWSVTSEHPGDAAFDEATSRLFAGTRTPPEVVVMDSKSGKEVAHLPTAEGMDGVYFDARRKRVYVSGGRGLPVGFAFVYQQKDADHYETIGKISTKGGAGTSFWSPELDRYYVAAPKSDNEEAAILVYAPQD